MEGFRERVREAREARREFMAEVDAGLRDEWGRKSALWEVREERRRERHRRHERERAEGKRPPRGEEDPGARDGVGDGRRRRRRQDEEDGVEILERGEGPLGRELGPEAEEAPRARGGEDVRLRPPPPKIEMRPWLKKLLRREPVQEGSSRGRWRGVEQVQKKRGRRPDSVERGGNYSSHAPGHPIEEAAPAYSEPVAMPNPVPHEHGIDVETETAAHPEAPVPMPDEADFIPAPADRAEGHAHHLDMHTDSEDDSVDDGVSEDGSDASTKATTAPPHETEAEHGPERSGVRGGGGNWSAEEYCLREEYDDEYESARRGPWSSSHQAALGRGQSWDPCDYRNMPLPPGQPVQMVPDPRFYRYSQAYVPCQAGHYSHQHFEFRYPPSQYQGDGRASGSGHYSRAEHGKYHAHDSRSYSGRPEGRKHSSPNHARSGRRQDGEPKRRTSRKMYEDESDSADESDESETESESDPDSGSEPSESSTSNRRQSPRSSGNGSHCKPDPIPPKPADFYAILGISADSSEEEIKVAAKKMRIRVHPDRMNLAEKTEEEKQQIHEESIQVGQAADVLSNPRRRREYHREVEEWEDLYGSRFESLHRVPRRK